ncbi:MAG: sigma factor, partial [Planctomycetota bacterium]
MNRLGAILLNLTDQDVRRAVAGDGDALTELLMELAPNLERALQIGRSWQSTLETADVMQVTYLEAFLQIGSCKADSLTSFESWLRRIAQNNLRDAIRGLERKKRPSPRNRVRAAEDSESAVGFLETIGVTTTTPSRHMARGELLRYLSSALESLPADYETAIRL